MTSPCTGSFMVRLKKVEGKMEMQETEPRYTRRIEYYDRKFFEKIGNHLERKAVASEVIKATLLGRPLKVLYYMNEEKTEIIMVNHITRTFSLTDTIKNGIFTKLKNMIEIE